MFKWFEREEALRMKEDGISGLGAQGLLNYLRLRTLDKVSK